MLGNHVLSGGTALEQRCLAPIALPGSDPGREGSLVERDPDVALHARCGEQPAQLGVDLGTDVILLTALEQQRSGEERPQPLAERLDRRVVLVSQLVAELLQDGLPRHAVDVQAVVDERRDRQRSRDGEDLARAVEDLGAARSGHGHGAVGRDGRRLAVHHDELDGHGRRAT